jgi:cytoskeletal protein RodZ
MSDARCFLKRLFGAQDIPEAAPYGLQIFGRNKPMDNAFDVTRVKAETDQEASAENIKALREAAGLSLHDIFAMTRVSIANLTALENGDFKNLPPPIYTRNFISKYAGAIGIDDKSLLERYEKYIATISEPSELVKIRKPWPENGLKYWFLYGSLAVVLAIGAVVVALFLYHTDKPVPAPVAETARPNSEAAASATENTTASTGKQPVARGVIPPAANKAATNAPDAKTETAAPTPGQDMKNGYHLSIKARETTWIRIVSDKTKSSQVLLKPGETIERTASDGFRLDIGNAGGVDISFQQKPLGRLGKSGEVITLNLPLPATNQNAN